MLDEEKFLRKQARIKKIEKRKTKTNFATLAGQVLRVKTARTYCGKKRHELKVKI